MDEARAVESEPTTQGESGGVKPPTTFGWIALAAVTIVTIVVVVTQDPSDNTTVSPYEAEQQCKRFIDQRIKSPGSADYALDTTGGPVTFTSTGTVDSENSFGASIRNTVTCTLRISGDTWTLESLTGLTN